MTRLQRLRFSLLAAGLLTSGSVLAEGLYFGASGGVAQADWPSQGQFDSQLARARPGLGSTLDETDTAWGLELGYRWGSYVAAEIGYIDLGKTQYDALSDAGAALYSQSRSSSGLTLSVLGMLPLGERFDLHGRVGAFFAESRVRDVIDDPSGTLNTYYGFSLVDYKESSTDLLAGFGAAWNVNDSLALRLEYTHFFDVGEDDDVEMNFDLLRIGILFR